MKYVPPLGTVIRELVVFSCGLVMAAWGFAIHNQPAPRSAIDPGAPGGVVNITGIANLERPEIGQYRLRFEGLTKSTVGQPAHGVRFVLDGDSARMHGSPNGEMLFSGVTGLMAVDAREAADDSP